MYEYQFDRWTKTLAVGQSRRRVLKRLLGSLGGGLAALAGGGRALGQSCRDAGRMCNSNGNCCSGLCDTTNDDPFKRNRCRCPDGFTNCRGTCVILDADLNNCGACAVVCPAGWDCCSGTCTDPNTDPTNCGGCGVPCRVNETCGGGECGCPVFLGRPCRPGWTCCPEAEGDDCRCSGGDQFVDPTTCAFVDQCPAGSTPCVGTTGTCGIDELNPSRVCCPAGTTCDTETGTCFQ
jgi:hypothetical protein